MALFDDPVHIIVIILVVTLVITAAMSVLFGMRLRSKKKPDSEEKSKSKDNKSAIVSDLEKSKLPFSLSKSIQTNTASNAKDELRILDLEREILGDSIRRLYEAQAEGKITETERDKLAVTYKNRMNVIKESIAKDETIVALHELEGMQEDLMQLFSERFGELTSKVEELRGRIDIKPIKEIPIKMPTPIPIQQMEQDDDEEETHSASVSSSNGGDDKPKKKRKSSTEKLDTKSEAEKRIESIRSEVEKVLDKLGQMEVEN